MNSPISKWRETVREVLWMFAREFAIPPDNTVGWWGHDTNLGDMKHTFEITEAAIEHATAELLRGLIGKNERHWTDSMSLSKVEVRNQLREELRQAASSIERSGDNYVKQQLGVESEKKEN